MEEKANIPREGDLHSIVTIGSHSFELRYGYCDKRDRAAGEPYILYPDQKAEVGICRCERMRRPPERLRMEEVWDET